MARRLEGTAVTANAVHPGVVNTTFGAEDPARAQRLLLPFARRFMKSPAEGATTSIRVASEPDFAGVTARFYANGMPKRSSKRSYDLQTAARLWQVSDALVRR